MADHTGDARRYVRARAERVWAPEVVDDWLGGQNSFLDGARPVDLIELGRINEVLAALDAEEQGSIG